MSEEKSLFYYAAGDVERSKTQYLSQFAHVGCGGQPVAFTAQGGLSCSVCKKTWAAPAPNAALGFVIARVIMTSDFYSLSIETTKDKF